MARKTERVNYEVDMKMNAEQANKALGDVVNHLEHITETLKASTTSTDKYMSSIADMLKAQNNLLQTQLNKLNKVGEKTKANTEQVKKQSDYQKELSNIINERSKLEEELNGKKLRSIKALKALATRYENQLKRADQARAVSAQNRSEQEKKWFLDKKRYAEIEIKLLNTKLDIKKAEALEEEKLNALQQKAYEIERLRLQVEGAKKAAANKPPTTATTQKAELDTLKKLAELEKRTHGETLEYYKLQKKAIERERDLKKTLAMDEKKAIHDRINLERAEAKKIEQTNAAKRLSMLKNIKQSDVLKEDLHVMSAELKVMESMNNSAHTLLEQERLRAQIHKKQVTLQKTLASEQKALDDSSLAGTLKHAAQVAPVYMMVAQGVNLLQQALGATVQAALEYDNTMRVLSAVTGESTTKTKELTEGVMLLGEAYGGTLADYAETAKELSRAGIDTDELVKATEVTAQLGLITGDTIQSASNAIISYSQVFQKAGGKIVYTTQELGDKLAYMANASRLSTEDIGTLSNYALASSKSIGLTIDAVNALAVSFSNAGNNASTIGTQIRRFTSTLTSNSTAVKEFYASIGVNRQDFMAKLLKSKSGDISDIEASNKAFEEFVRNVQSLSENEYRSAIQGMNILDNQFFNQLRNNGDEIISHLKKSFGDLDGELDKTAVIADGLAKRWERMGNRIVNANESWTAAVGAAITQMSEDIMNVGADVGDTVNQWLSSGDIATAIGKMKEARDVMSRNTHTVDFSSDEEAVKYARVAKQLAEKQLALQTQIKDAKLAGKDIDTQTLAESKKLSAEMRAYDEITKLVLANQGKKSDEVVEKIATIKVRLKEQLAADKALLDVETRRVAKLKLIKEINEQRGAKKAVAYFEDLDDKGEYEKVKLQIARDIVDEKEKLIQKYIKQANLSQEEVRQLKVSKETRKSINEETLLSNRLSKEEVQSLETLGRALKNTYDQRQLTVGLQAVQAGIDRNTQANAKYMTSLIASENRLKELGLDLDLNKANVGSQHLQQLIDEKNWLEAVSTIQIAQQLVLQEKGKLKELQVAKEKELLGLSGEQLAKAKKDIQNLETKQQALNGIENQLTLQSGILSDNLQITNSMTSAFKNMDTVITNQLIPLREVTKELERQHKIKIASAGLDKDIVIANSRKEALAAYGARVDSLYSKAKSQAEYTALNKEVMKDVRRINDYYNNLDLQAKQELNRKKEQLEKDLQKSLVVVGKSGLKAKKALYNKERNDKIALAKKLYKDETILKSRVAEVNKVYDDKITKATIAASKKRLRATNAATRHMISTSKKHYKAVKDEFKIKSQLLELEVLQAKLSGKYNKLEVLKKELKLLKEQSTAGLKDFDLNKHKIDILNKQLEIKKEQKEQEKRQLKEAKKRWSEYDKYVETEWDKTTKYLADTLEENFFNVLDGKFTSLKDTFKGFADGLVLDPLKHNVSKNLSGATLAMLGINTTADGKTLDSYLGDNGFKQVAGEFVKYVGDTKVVIDQAGNVLEGQEKVSTELMDNLSVLKSAYSTYTAGLQASIMQPFANAGTFLAEHGYATAGSSITSLGVGVANPFSTGIVASQGGWGSMAGAGAGIGQMAVGGLVGYGVGTLGDKLFGADTQAGNLGALGGAIGTAILPGLGTAIGAGLGSVIGGMFGSTKVTDTGILFNSLSSYNNFDALSYVDKKKSSWFSSSSSTDTSALGKDVEERINSVFHTYDYLLNQLEIFNSNLAITGGKYSQDSFSDEIARSFLGTITGGGKEDIKSSLLKQVEGLTDPMDIANILYKGLFGRLPEEFNNGSGADYEYFVNALNSLGTEGIINNLIARGTAETLNSSLKQSNELLDVWKKYAKSVDKNVMETLSEAFGEYTTKKRSFDIWRSSSYGDDIGALGKKKDYALQDLKFTLDSVGDSTITVDNYLERMNEALRGNPTPQVLQDWENLGDALIKASDSVKAFQDAVRKDMSSLIKDEVNRLRNLREATKANIVSLQNKQAQYLPQTTIYSSDVYKAIGDWSPKKDQAIQNLIDTWRNQQVEVANKQVEAEKTRIDNINKEIEANNRLRETILKLKDSVQATFDNIRGLSDSSKKESLQNAIDNKEYDKINSLFSSYASSKIDNAGYFGRVDALVEIAKMNQQVQELDTPVEKTKLEASLKIQELTDNINKSVATMYEALIKQNENYLPNIDGQLIDIFVQNQQYFDENSDIYKFMEQSAMGTKEETFEQRMQEQYDLYQTTSDLETTMLDRNFKNLGDISKQLNVKTNNNANDIAELRRELTALRKAQEESNRIAQQQLAVAQETANNTKESGVIA